MLFPALALALLLGACGGGGGSSSSASSAGSASTGAGGTVASATTSYGTAPLSNVQAARFLNQATYGARPQDIAPLQAQTIDAWITAQEALPASVENFTISLDGMGGSCGLKLDWEKTRASITISGKN